MNKIFNLIITIIFVSLILIVYIKIDTISNFFLNIMNIDNKLVFNNEKKYVRDYNYLKFYISDEYIVNNKDDILNVFFNQLNNGNDNFTFYCNDEYKECITDVKDIINDDELISKVNNYISPFNSFKKLNSKIYDNGKINVSVVKNYSLSDITELEKRIDDIIYELNINGVDDEVEKIRSIHNYIIKNVKYDEEMAVNKTSSYKSNTAYGALVQGYAICTGYSDAMALFLDKLMIPNIQITSLEHVWNLVYINNEWKHLDLTWNDTENAKYQTSYFLIDTNTLYNLDKAKHNFNLEFYLEAK